MLSLTGTGVWSSALRYNDPALIADTAGELEELGYKALWIPDFGGDVFGAVHTLLQATQNIVIGTGVLNLWMHSAEHVAEEHGRLSMAFGRRFLLGIGVGHAQRINEFDPSLYRHPLQKITEYLDQLDALASPVSKEDRVLAALGPKMTQLAKTRAAGSHLYNVVPAHTAMIRKALGPDAHVAPEQAVLLETDPARARQIGRHFLARYLALENYTANWLRTGYSEDDFLGGGSDRLVDSVVAWGDEGALAERVQEHRDAGANHVAVQVITANANDLPVEQWRILAPALTVR